MTTLRATDRDQLAAFTASVEAWLQIRGMTRADLARAMGVDRCRVTHLLGGYQGRSPSLRTLREVAAALGMDLRVELVPRATHAGAQQAEAAE